MASLGAVATCGQECLAGRGRNGARAGGSPIWPARHVWGLCSQVNHGRFYSGRPLSPAMGSRQGRAGLGSRLAAGMTRVAGRDSRRVLQ